MLGDIYRGSDHFDYLYYKKIGENHRLYNMDLGLITDFTEDRFNDLKLLKTYNDITESLDPVIVGGITYASFMKQVKFSCNESIYSDLKVFSSPLEFREKVYRWLERDDLPMSEYRTLYQGLFIYENFNDIINRKDVLLNSLCLAESTLKEVSSDSVKTEMLKELNNISEELELITISLKFV